MEGMTGHAHQRYIIAQHLILHGYGHWLPNDPRGSGSDEVREEKLQELGPIHPGRKTVQPPRSELREFYRQANPKLDFTPIWFEDAKRQVVGGAFAEVVRSQRYTVYACAVLKNHAHLCVRRHRDDARTMWSHFADASRSALRSLPGVADDHPVWSIRPYKVFLYTPEDVRRVVAYIESNPVKERLAPQNWALVTPYDGWPHLAKK